MCSCYISLVAAWCWILMTFVDELKEMLCSLDETSKIEKNSMALRKEFDEFIEFHADVQKLKYALLGC